ncbi:DUF7502 family protein [Halarchaeum nitratireducens]|uniref:Uncharacterized protein n=1 Tax=Halarchaeum nitratireducens TaxID=489913 RepID=A0A830GFB2_9EURY|nr:hypothetical protein [Halarchaeum nitratireducens]GGN22372.1 hypothetical protein GCM10009021_24890 [Halarchaeum nitratireducens]
MAADGRDEPKAARAPDTDTDTDADGADRDRAAASDRPRDERGEARERMAAALRAVRREGRKVAAIYATVDAVLLGLLADLACATIAAVPARVALPAAAPIAALPVPTLAAAVVGALVFATEYGYRTRRPLVEQFEAANPGVREALRTARDAVDAGSDTRMAARLYERVLDDLRETSSVALLDARRVAVTVVAVVVVSLLCVHAAIAGIAFDVGGGPGPATAGSGGGGGGGGGGTSDEYGGLQNGSGVLGDPTDARAGDDALNASVDASGGGPGGDDPESYDAGGYTGGSDAAIESQQAGYDDPTGIEDAELIREYTLRIRSNQSQ